MYSVFITDISDIMFPHVCCYHNCWHFVRPRPRWFVQCPNVADCRSRWCYCNHCEPSSMRHLSHRISGLFSKFIYVTHYCLLSIICVMIFPPLHWLATCRWPYLMSNVQRRPILLLLSEISAEQAMHTQTRILSEEDISWEIGPILMENNTNDSIDSKPCIQRN